MDPLSVSVGVLAVALAGFRTFMLIRVAINGEAFLRQIEKLIKSDNVARAIKLCSAVPGSVIAAATRAALLVSASRDGDTVELVRIRLADAYAKERDIGFGQVARGAVFGWAGGALGLVALALGLTAEPMATLAAGLGAFAILVSLHSMWSFGSQRRQAREVGDGVIDAVVAHHQQAAELEPQVDPTRAREMAAEIGSRLGLGAAERKRDKPDGAARADDMRGGSCALCGGGHVTQRPFPPEGAAAGDPAREGFIAFVCTDCGFTQLFAVDAIVIAVSRR